MPNIQLINCDCMIYMAGLPDKAFELAIVTQKYVYLWYENITRITNRKGRRVYSLCRPYFKGVCSFYKRTRIAIRRAFGYGQKDFTSAGENNHWAKNYTPTCQKFISVYFQCEEKRQKQQEEVCWYRNRLVCPCVLRYKKGGLHTNKSNAGHDKHSGRFFKRHLLRRERNTGLQSGLLNAWQVFKRNIQTNRLAYIYNQPNASGGVQTL